MPATSPLSQARIVVILLSVPVTLLLLRNNLIPLPQSSNFILSLLNHSGSGTMFFGMIVCLFCTASASAVNISSIVSVSVVSFEVSSLVILNNLSHFDNAS